MKSLQGAAFLLLPFLLLPSAAKAQQTFRCESISGQTQYCDVNTRGGVELVRQLSRAGCWEGDTWGVDRRGLWVSNGCRAEFALSGYQQRYDDGRRDKDSNTGAVVAGAVVLGLIGAAILADGDDDDHRDRDRGDDYGRNTITCESDDGRYQHCQARVRGHVEIERVLSKSECRYGQTWGSDREGVWVDRGCRARFVVD